MMLEKKFPRTFEALSALPDGAATLAHIDQLERGFLAPRGIAITDDGPGAGAMEFDVAIAGGGLSLVYAAWLARAGFRVVVFDRGRIGRGHREWNISRPELAPLVESGLFTDEEVKRLVLMEYARGIVRWHGGETYAVRNVLDCVVDSSSLLLRLRALAEAAGATLLDGHRLAGYRLGEGGVRVDLVDPANSKRTIDARLFVDATGSQSPHARFDLACPTVGGVMEGLAIGSAPDELDPEVGEILVSTEGVEDRRQHIWEGFPAPQNRATVYLFYYAEPDTLGEHPLFSLYERFFRLRARYKRGPATVDKPTYGFIPGYTRLRPAPTAPHDRVILVGDAASRHSPITFCGFGSMIRSFLPVGEGLRALLERDRLSRRSLASVWTEPTCLGLLGALALMMIPAGGRGANGPARGDGDLAPDDDINRLLDAAFGALASLGEEVFAKMVRDEIGFPDFVRFMRVTAKRRPSIYRDVFQRLSPEEIATWTARFASLGARQWLPFGLANGRLRRAR